MTQYRSFQRRDLPRTLIRSVIGAFMGFVTVTLIAIFGGLWWLMIPVLILQLIGQTLVRAVAYGLAWLWRVTRGQPSPGFPPRATPASAPAEPWILHHGFLIGFAASGILTTLQAWRTGAFGAIL